MAFALTLFVEAANRKLPPPVAPSQDDDEVCKYLYSILCAGVPSLSATAHLEADHHTTLYTAFGTLCSYYDGDPLQAAVCARVLAFHFLMEGTAGAVLSEWLQPHPESIQLVELHPAVVEAIATIRLHGSVLLPERVFAQLVAERARSMVERFH